MFPWLDSDVNCVEGEKQRVRMLSQTPRYVWISNRIYPTKSIPQTSRIPYRENNAPQNRALLRERGWMTCLRFYVLYIILVSSGRRKGDNGKQFAMKSRLQLKRFPSPASVGNRVLDRLIIKPAP